MLNKEQHIEYWINTAREDWEAVLDIVAAKRYVHALFFSHLTLEKLLKAHWVKDNEENHPPKIHNLVRIASKTKLNTPEKYLIFMEKFNDFQMEGRYPDYWNMIYKIVTKEYTLELIENIKEIREWLLKQMP